jgi:diguanylate cyclase (GGDEF)-like protein
MSKTEAMLRERGQRLGCAAMALLTSTGAVQRIWARSRSSLDFANKQFESLAGLLITRCIDQRDTLVSNRVRPSADGPVVAQLIAAPVSAAGQRPVGIVAALWRPNEPAFNGKAALAVRKVAELVARRIPPDKDQVTGLLTWPGFCRRMDRIGATCDANTPIAVLYGNIDQLHLFNNARGMSFGDQAIVHAAMVLRRGVCAVRHVACRLSGDRFVVALPDCTVEAARDLAESIRTGFESEAQRLFGTGTSLSISFGVAVSRNEHRDFDRALTDAELACRAAKDRGRNRIEVFQATDVSMIRRHDDIDAIRLLRNALDSDQLVIFAQPIMPLLNLALPTSYELLVRIARRDGSIAEPAEFMSAASRYQMLPMLDHAVVSKAFAQMRAAAGDAERLPFSFAVNLAAATLGAPNFCDWLSEQMQRHSIPGNQLTLEITESTASASLEQLQVTIARLARVGVRFAIDDFGTGSNSLSHIKSLDVGSIKLDGSYVRDLINNSRSQALVRAIVQLADSMGVVTVAEYVDSVALRARLAELGVHFAQGFAVGRPEPLTDLLAIHAEAPALRSA